MTDRPIPLNVGPQYRQNARVAYQVIDGRAFLVQPRDHTLHRLDEIGTLIWEALERPSTPEAVAMRLSEVYDVDADIALRDARDFIDELARKDLIVPAGS